MVKLFGHRAAELDNNGLTIMLLSGGPGPNSSRQYDPEAPFAKVGMAAPASAGAARGRASRPERGRALPRGAPPVTGAGGSGLRRERGEGCWGGRRREKTCRRDIQPAPKNLRWKMVAASCLQPPHRPDSSDLAISNGAELVLPPAPTVGSKRNDMRPPGSPNAAAAEPISLQIEES